MQMILKNAEIQTCIGALDFYSRIFMGQFEEIEMLMWRNGGYRGEYTKYKFARRHILTAMRNLMFYDTNIAEWDLNGSLGIWSLETDGRAKIAYDMQQVIRHADAWCRIPEGGIGRQFDSPDFGGELEPIECKCCMENGEEIAIITLQKEHMKIIKSSIEVYLALAETRIRDMMLYYTQNAIVLSLADIFENLIDKREVYFAGIERIKDLSEKVMELC